MKKPFGLKGFIITQISDLNLVYGYSSELLTQDITFILKVIIFTSVLELSILLKAKNLIVF